jgi:hypothetical protein
LVVVRVAVVVNGKICQCLHDKIAALPATLCHLQQLPLLLEAGQRQLVQLAKTLAATY